MKKSILLLLSITLALSMASQALVTPSSEWYYSTGNDFANGYVHVYYNQDTIIDGSVWMQFDRYYEAVSFMDQVTMYSGEFDPLYYQANADQVYRYIDGASRLLYDMTMGVGDSLTTYSNTNGGCIANGVSVVDSVGVMNIQGQNFRYLYLRSIVNNNGLYSMWYGYVIERIGGMTLGLPVEIALCDGYQTYSLRCFNETDFMYLNPDYTQSCDYVVGIDEVEKHTIEMYPNPSSGIFYFDLPAVEISEMWIYNALGEVVMKKSNLRNPAQTIDLSHQPKGIYSIHWISSQGSEYVGEVVVF